MPSASRTATLLREHGAAGRLDVEELEQRVGAAYQARTRGELATLLDDLPRAQPVSAPRSGPPLRRHPITAGACSSASACCSS